MGWDCTFNWKAFQATTTDRFRDTGCETVIAVSQKQCGAHLFSRQLYTHLSKIHCFVARSLLKPNVSQ